MHGQTDLKLSQNSDFCSPHFLAHKSRVGVEFDMDMLTFAAAVLSLTIDWTTLNFVDFELTVAKLSERVV